MFKAIFFDFDGVILESSEIKTEAFSDLFAEFPDKQEEIVNYHIKNAGISRYVKFKYFYNELLGQELSSEKEKELASKFSEIVFNKVMAAPFVSGAKEFLEENHQTYKFFVVSGTPQEELDLIVKNRGLQNFFLEVRGTPQSKQEIIED